MKEYYGLDAILQEGKMNSVVVMGGSFNPPTIAHLKMMQTALDAVQAQRGFFVPVSFPYLKRKMVKAGQSHLCLSDELRIRMLSAMIASDQRIRLCTDNMNDAFSDDAGIMKGIQKQFPDARIYYVAGTDKLDLLDHIAWKSDFFDRFSCILFSRDCKRATEEMDAYEHLSACRNAFIPVKSPEEIDGISSTRIREHIFHVDAVAEMLHPSVVTILKELKAENYPEEILQFRDEYDFLSNAFPAEMTFEGISYPCAESAFLASRYEDLAEKKRISSMKPEKAKQKYAAFPGNSEWVKNQDSVMEEIVRQKFSQRHDLMEKLMETGNRYLVNGGKKDSYWGVHSITWVGENRLGLILMKIRDEHRKG